MRLATSLSRAGGPLTDDYLGWPNLRRTIGRAEQ
jgi:hypothetical protein